MLIKSRRSLHRFALGAVLLLAAACGEGGSDIIDPDPPASTKPPVVVLDSTQARLVSDSATEAAGTYRFVVSGSAPSIKANDIIVGPQGGGFLRRVSSFVRRGDTLVVQTTFASLEEAVEEGSFNINVPLRTGAAASAAPSSAALQNVVWGEPVVLYAMQGVTLGQGALNLSGTTLFDREGLKVTIPTGSIGFEPDLDVGATFERTGLIGAKLSSSTSSRRVRLACTPR